MNTKEHLFNVLTPENTHETDGLRALQKHPDGLAKLNQNLNARMD